MKRISKPSGENQGPLLTAHVKGFRQFIMNLTVRYVTTLCTIALIVSSCPLLVTGFLDRQEACGKFILLATELSNLSQSMSESAFSYQLGDRGEKRDSDTLYRDLAYLDELSFRIHQKAHEIKLPSTFEKVFQHNLRDMDSHFYPFLAGVKNLLHDQRENQDSIATLIQDIMEEGRKVKNALSASIQNLEEALSEGVVRFKRIEWIFSISTLIVLMSQGLFILRPAVRKVENTLLELKASEKRLLEAKEEAISALRVRSDFVTKTSHEIRNPLNVILGMGDLLRETPLDPSQRRYVEIFRRAGQAILDLTNEFLDFSRLEANGVELEKISFNLSDIVERALDIVSSRAEEKNLELNLDVDWTLPFQLRGDPKRIQQILVNLLGNAVKFTNSGSVTLQVKKEEISEGLPRLILIVSDTGIGIPPDRQSRIFEDFVQVDSSITRNFGGTGLGLAICRDLIKLMDGQITLESELGKGSVFTVSLPLILDKPDLYQNRFKHLGLSKMKIGWVDSNERRMAAGSGFLNLFGITVEAVKTPLNQYECRKYDVILIDDQFFYEFERMNVFPAKVIFLTRLKDLYKTSSRFSSNNKFVCIPKPLKLSQLIHVLADLENKEGQLGASLPSAPLISFQGVRILIVEDSDDNRTLLNAYLKTTDAQVEFATNGKEGLEAFQKNQFDILFMDIQMPEMDGFTATRAIRKREKEHGQGSNPVPIVALTAFGNQEEIQKCFEAGCNRHLTKPIRRADLIRVIKEFQGNFKAVTGKDEKIKAYDVSSTFPSTVSQPMLQHFSAASE